MHNVTKKQAILQSLEAMNAVEMNQVIDYIKELLYTEERDVNYQNFKQKALDEIQKALNSDDVSVPA